MNVIEEIEVVLARVDWAVSQLAGLEMDWEGAAAQMARSDASLLLKQLVAVRTQLSQARLQLQASRAYHASALAGALMGLG